MGASEDFLYLMTVVYEIIVCMWVKQQTDDLYI